MSLGGSGSGVTLPPDETFPPNAAILAAADEGIVFCIAAGNDGLAGNPVTIPAYLASINKNVLSIASVGPSGKVAVYSTQQPYNSVAAPGGDATDTGYDPNMIYSTIPTSAYGYMQGTSMASPAAAGVVALLLSAGGDPGQIDRAHHNAYCRARCGGARRIGRHG